MFLKSIRMSGFKSFGAPTTMEFDQGVTVIVGPNGSGKSNIVDAVAWATGGLSTRGLRADRTEDLLFCGASGLSPASRAEVTLVFDNTSGQLPIDRPEVAITRRHYRSGESEFEINRTPCRLLDITELLAEAGLRRSRHVLLGQGQVEQVLNASPAEHRQVLEEAAGVGKHLARRDRAVRRLESARSDLERIGEVIAEKQRRLKPLARQANAWNRYSRLGEEVRSLRLYLEGENLRELEANLASAVDRREQWDAVRSEAVDHRARHLEALADLEAAQGALRLDAVGDLVRDWEMVSEKMKRLSEVAALRSEAHRQQQRDRRRRQALSTEQAGLGDRLAEVDGSLAAAEATVVERGRAVAGLTKRHRELSARMDTSIGASLGVARAEWAALRAVVERDGAERQSLESRMAELSAHMEELQSHSAAVGARQTEHQAAVAEAGEMVAEAKTAAWEKRRALREAEAAAASARTVMAEALGRLESTRRSLRAGDPEDRRRLEASTGWAGWVSDLVEAPPELAPAVAAALEGWRLAGAFEGPVALGAALERLDGVSGGEGPLSMVSTRFPGAAAVPARAVAATGGNVAPLVDLLEGGDPSELVVRLLGDVVLVDNWRLAWEVVGNHPQLRAVTPGGDLITARGIRLGRGNALPDLGAVKAEVQKTAADCESRREEVRYLRQEADRLEKDRDYWLDVLQNSRQQLSESQREAGRLQTRSEEMTRERHRLGNRLGALREAEKARNPRIEELADQVNALQAQAERTDQSESLARQLKEVAADRAGAEEEYRSANELVTKLRERRKLEGARYEQLVVELAEISYLPRSGTAGNADQVAELASAALGVMSAHTPGVRAMHRDARRRAQVLAEEATEARRAIGRADQREREATGKLEGLIAEVSRLEARRQTTVEALYEMGADPSQAAQAPRPEVDDPRGALASAVAQLERAKPANPYAAHDLAQLEEELAELCDQRDDIVQSDRRLKELIVQLETEATDRYLATFGETARAFEQTFGQVFPGGQGRLRIVDPEDPLGSGVEIRARPQGKRVSRLSLLSGGERALGALAFLFALMKTRPAPFYLLDEMDASLDAANLHRVLEVVRELRSHAQILIITHQPQTAEFGEVLYGVTLPPGGATQVVSRRMKPATHLEAPSHPQARSA